MQVAEATRRVQFAEADLRRFLAHRENQWAEFRVTGVQLQPSMLLLHSRYQGQLAMRISAVQAELVRLQVEQEQAMAQYVEARRRRELLEKLMDRRRREWERELARLEQKELDEVGTRRSTNE